MAICPTATQDLPIHHGRIPPRHESRTLYKALQFVIFVCDARNMLKIMLFSNRFTGRQESTANYKTKITPFCLQLMVAKIKHQHIFSYTAEFCPLICKSDSTAQRDMNNPWSKHRHTQPLMITALGQGLFFFILAFTPSKWEKELGIHH